MHSFPPFPPSIISLTQIHKHACTHARLHARTHVLTHTRTHSCNCTCDPLSLHPSFSLHPFISYSLETETDICDLMLSIFICAPQPAAFTNMKYFVGFFTYNQTANLGTWFRRSCHGAYTVSLSPLPWHLMELNHHYSYESPHETEGPEKQSDEEGLSKKPIALVLTVHS